MNEAFEQWLDERKKKNYKREILSAADTVDFLNEVKSMMFPGYVEAVLDKTFFDGKIYNIRKQLTALLEAVSDIEEVKLDATAICESFLNELPRVDYLLKTDVVALFEGDPAAKSTNEIILCYPGLSAIFTYRIAHILYNLNVPILPRLLSEYAHSRTGIDIHPGATIDEYFFIDHGTGIVIGETTVIGKNVKIYQGVTLGALSLREGQRLKGSKRHPTIEDNVTIYSGASIFGGDTIIGKNSTIGSSAFITSSVEPDTVVTISGVKKHKSKED